MENVDKTIGTAAKFVGPTVKQMGQELKFSIYDMRAEIVDLMNEQGLHYEEETINGFLYRRPWPDKLSRNATIEIISNAFERILIKKERGNEVQAVRKQVVSTLEKLFDDCEQGAIDDILHKVLAEYLLTDGFSRYTQLISKYFEACCSLTSNDMEFWDIVSEWSPERKKRQCEKWSGKKLDFQTIFSPIFQQWLSIYEKNFYDQIRKDEKGTSKPSLNFKKQLDKVTGDEANSLVFLWRRLVIAEKADSQRTKKYPFGQPEEIGLLLLFKYGFSSDDQKTMLEKLNGHNKSGG